VHVGTQDHELAGDRNVNDQDTGNHAADGGCSDVSRGDGSSFSCGSSSARGACTLTDGGCRNPRSRGS
jgi:hypothetical protein